MIKTFNVYGLCFFVFKISKSYFLTCGIDSQFGVIGLFLGGWFGLHFLKTDIYIYIAPEHLQPPQKENMTNLRTQLEVKTNTSSFDPAAGIGVSFRLALVPWKKSLLMGLFGSTNLKILYRQDLEFNEIWSLRTPKENSTFSAASGFRTKASNFFIQVEVFFFVGWGFLDVDGTFGPFFFFCRGADQSSSTAEGGEGAKEVWRGFSSEMGVFLSLKNQALLR